jgi:hypothetical protein
VQLVSGSRTTIEQVEAGVEAAEEQPEEYGHLLD